jgi:hypothetical protein
MKFFFQLLAGTQKIEAFFDMKNTLGQKTAKTFLVLAVTCLIAGTILNPIPIDPDTQIQTSAIAGAFLIFLFWAIATLAWGNSIAMLTRLTIKSYLLMPTLGIAGASLTAFVLGSTGLLGESNKALAIILCFLGIGINLYIEESSTTEPKANLSRTEYFLVLFTLSGLFITVLIRLLMASIPHFFSDPLFYNLLGPRLWHSEGKILFNTQAPLALLTTQWDYLNIWANYLLAGTQAAGIIEVQLFSQWTTVLFGVGGAALALMALFRIFNVKTHESVIASFFAIMSGTAMWFSWLAKNDWGSIAWTFAGSAILFSSKRLRDCVVAGILFGFACTKLTSVPHFISALVAYGLFTKRENSFFLPSRLFTVCLAAALASLTVFGRNFIFTGNPFFPALNQYFNSPYVTMSMLPFFSHTTHAIQPHEKWKLIIDRVSYLCLNDPLSLLLLFVGIIQFTRWRSKEPLFRVTSLITAAGLIFFVILFRAPEALEDGTHLLRYAASFIILANGLTCLYLLRSTAEKPIRLLIVTFLLLFATMRSGLPLSSTLNLISHPVQITNAIRVLPTGGDSKAWLRMNAKPEEKIVSTGDNQLYYLPHFSVIIIPEDPALDKLFSTLENPMTAVKALRARGAKFLLDSEYYSHRYWGRAAFILDKAVSSHPETIVFKGRASRVIDLEKLANLL